MLLSRPVLRHSPSLNLLIFFLAVALLRHWHPRRIHGLIVFRLLVCLLQVALKLLEESFRQPLLLQRFPEQLHRRGIGAPVFKA